MDGQPMTTKSAATVASDSGTHVTVSPEPKGAVGRSSFQQFLGSLLRVQMKLVDADAGLLVLLPSEARKGGVEAAATAADRVVTLGEDWPQAILGRLDRHAKRYMANADADHGTQSEFSTFGAGGSHEAIVLSDHASVYSAEATHTLLISPLAAGGRIEGICALAIRRQSRLGPEEGLVRLELASAQFESYLWRENAIAEAEQRIRLRETLELLDVGMQGQSAKAMGQLLCGEINRKFGCTRVSMGLIKGPRIRVVAVSGSDELDPHSTAVEAIEASMEECAAQDAEVIWPSPPEMELDPGNRRVTRSHRQLSEKFGPSAVLSLPLRVEGDLVGVMVLERPSGDPFPLGSVGLLRLLAEFVGPSLWTRRLADRGVFAVTRDRVMDLGGAIVGPRHTGAKLIALLALLILVGLAVIPIPDRVRSSAEVRAEVARTVPPPFTGYLEQVLVRPGDRVSAGDVIARMDTTELRLQLEQEVAKRATLEVERDNAHATGDLATWRRVARGVEEVDAKVALIESYLVHAEVRSPIDGVVSRGDLDDFLGARVEPTTALFEIATSDRLAVIEVDERSIQRVRIGQEGYLVARSMPSERVPVRVVRINPSTEAVKGGNVFLVEVEIPSPPGFLRPGTTGTVRLRDGWTTGMAALLRPVIDELQLRLWW
jgi:RND family efflux transporter MFP subunit